ncbi:hypothetical protein MMC12_000028 [Toensbergia leucococca]|nr:hypothetical protein [Toensbergia leucococca]
MDYELIPRPSFESNGSSHLDDAQLDSENPKDISKVYLRRLLPRSLLNLLPLRLKLIFNKIKFRQKHSRKLRQRKKYQPRSSVRRICAICNVFLAITLGLIVLFGLFLPSYTYPPAHYLALSQKAYRSTDNGRVNKDNEKVFIAASIYDNGGYLAGGAWGKAILSLVHLLGHENVFLSIYENDGGVEGQAALKALELDTTCNHSLIFEEHLPLEDIPRITLPDGSKRVKRMSYLAEVRNRALLPLDETSAIIYDKLLFLNDVVFDPVDAAQLLFSTNVNGQGKATYDAACAVDFINPFKLYDTFATRDFEGYSMGLPFFPWFSSAGHGMSRQDVLAEKDAVRVKSCWGGMVVFDAKWFQASKSQKNAVKAESYGYDPDTDRDMRNAMLHWDDADADLALNVQLTSQPIRFRAEPDLYWDASECCLIHADLQSTIASNAMNETKGIYQNPFIRVAYDSRSLGWLRFTRRFERLYTVPHDVINHLVGLPWFNPHRGDKEREGGFCGMRTLQLIKDVPRKGERNWESVSVPALVS